MSRNSVVEKGKVVVVCFCNHCSVVLMVQRLDSVLDYLVDAVVCCLKQCAVAS
jgi:hypothetical protein